MRSDPIRGARDGAGASSARPLAAALAATYAALAVGFARIVSPEAIRRAARAIPGPEVAVAVEDDLPWEPDADVRTAAFRRRPSVAARAETR